MFLSLAQRLTSVPNFLPRNFFYSIILFSFEIIFRFSFPSKSFTNKQNKARITQTDSKATAITNPSDLVYMYNKCTSFTLPSTKKKKRLKKHLILFFDSSGDSRMNWSHLKIHVYDDYNWIRCRYQGCRLSCNMEQLANVIYISKAIFTLEIDGILLKKKLLLHVHTPPDRHQEPFKLATIRKSFKWITEIAFV